MAKRRSERVAETNGAGGETAVAVAETPAGEDPGFTSPGETKPAKEETPRPAEACVNQPLRAASIEMPTGPASPYASDHIEVRLKGKEIIALDHLWTGCQQENLFLADGRRVVSRADVVRLVFERFADAMEA